MFVLRNRPMLVMMRRSPHISVMASSTGTTPCSNNPVSSSGEDNNCQLQVRNYGRACPAVRRHAAKKKKAAAAAVTASATDAYSTAAVLPDAPSASASTEAMAVASMTNLANLKAGDDGPTMEIAKSMPISFKNMDNISLLTLSALKNEQARAEMLRRHIMTVDNVPYSEACKTFEEIAAENRRGMLKHTIPYKLGITAAVGGGLFSIPLCFHLPSVHWFNERFVTTDVPEPQDLETWLEVGSWAWNWMEPPLGQISFLLLCLQFARAQIANLGVRPYTAKIKAMRADKIVAKYPQYDATLLSNYSKSVNFY